MYVLSSGVSQDVARAGCTARFRSHSIKESYMNSLPHWLAPDTAPNGIKLSGADSSAQITLPPFLAVPAGAAAEAAVATAVGLAAGAAAAVVGAAAGAVVGAAAAGAAVGLAGAPPQAARTPAPSTKAASASKVRRVSLKPGRRLWSAVS